MPTRFVRVVCFLVLLLISATWVPTAQMAPPADEPVQPFLDRLPSPLKTYRDGDQTAAEWIQAVSSYYGVHPRLLLALLEANEQLLSTPNPPESVLRKPFGAAGPDGFGAQIDWAARDIRAGFGPYDHAPTVHFTDGTTLTLTLSQAPEGVAVQRFLARDRSQSEWRAAVDRFGAAFQRYFNNELPELSKRDAPSLGGWLQQPWPAEAQVVHLAYFDHIYPTVDTDQDDNGYVVNYLGRGGVQYDGHDGHDFYFPDKAIGTPILAAAGGRAYARTHRGNGVVIVHPNGYETVYWHLDAFAQLFQGKVDTDRWVDVQPGDLLGTSGKSGFASGTPHLHFEVRHNGRQVDPYGWYGPGSDPCAGYTACEPSIWLWSDALTGTFDFTPPTVSPPDTEPPAATLTVNPDPAVLLSATFDSTALQQIGAGVPTADGVRYGSSDHGTVADVPKGGRLSFPTAGNIDLAQGTIVLWANLPEQYPFSRTGRHYLFAASAHPDEGPVYTGTLALRRERDDAGAYHWNFWTVDDSGQRNDLLIDDLAPGWHQFAISWDAATGRKTMFVDGSERASADNVAIPGDVGTLIDIGQFSPGHGVSQVPIRDLVILGRASKPTAIAALASAASPSGNAAVVTTPTVHLDVNAMDNGGGIVRVQTGVNGVFGDPMPYADSYDIELPPATGTYTVAVRLADRAENTTVVSATVKLVDAPRLSAEVASEYGLIASIKLDSPDAAGALHMQLSAEPTFADAEWHPFASLAGWQWNANTPRLVWVRVRRTDGATSAPLLLGSDAQRIFLPIISGR